MSASLATAHAHKRGAYYARQLRSWAKSSELHTHLQSIGKYVKAANLVQYLSDSLVQKRFGMKSTISLAIAKRWMHTLGYHWLRDHHGQYVDGHKHADVIRYCQGIFIPAMIKNKQHLKIWGKDGITSKLTLSPGERQVEQWFHDEVTFYANDWCHSVWIHIDAGSDPCPKGEGTSIMVSDFVSADQGWCCSPDGQESARVLFRTGKARDGWFTNEDILKQTSQTMDILEKHHPNSDHGTKEWGVDKVVVDAAGKPSHGPDEKVLKMKSLMKDAHFVDGSAQPLYFPLGHEHARKFKDMAVILKERGFKVDKLKAQCKGFKCKEGATNCCCRRILFNKPDFVDVPTLLQALCAQRGSSFQVLILPKFHSTKKDDEMEANVFKALNAVPIEFANRSRRFEWQQAAWANKKYRGHHVLPDNQGV
ncbi:hypothetical protein BDN67DRAFT_992719 [Paxillus ammoniavirescens]|nr:hypothetical protein BDN67DRAFT_992719 [Paxillus ammoniavirescens]